MPLNLLKKSSQRGKKNKLPSTLDSIFLEEISQLVLESSKESPIFPSRIAIEFLGGENLTNLKLAKYILYEIKEKLLREQHVVCCMPFLKEDGESRETGIYLSPESIYPYIDSESIAYGKDGWSTIQISFSGKKI